MAGCGSVCWYGSGDGGWVSELLQRAVIARRQSCSCECLAGCRKFSLVNELACSSGLLVCLRFSVGCGWGLHVGPRLVQQTQPLAGLECCKSGVPFWFGYSPGPRWPVQEHPREQKPKFPSSQNLLWAACLVDGVQCESQCLSNAAFQK